MRNLEIKGLYDFFLATRLFKYMHFWNNFIVSTSFWVQVFITWARGTARDKDI